MIHSCSNAIDYVNATLTMLWWSRTDTSTPLNGLSIVNYSSSHVTGTPIWLISEQKHTVKAISLGILNMEIFDSIVTPTYMTHHDWYFEI